MKIRSCLLFAIILAMSGCKYVFGIRPYKSLTESEIKTTSGKFDVSPDEVATLDTGAYTIYLKGIQDTILKGYLSKPLQIRVYDKNGKKTMLLVNCEVGGFPNLKWNRYGSFDRVPLSIESYYNYSKYSDTLMTLEKDLAFFKRAGGQKISEEEMGVGDFTMVIYWTRFMGRQSRRLIKMAHNYKNKHAEKHISLLCVNVDNLYYKAFKKKG